MAKITPPHSGYSPPKGINRKWAWHYQTLLQHRQRLIGQEAQHLRDVVRPIEAEVTDPAERGEDQTERDLAAALLQREPEALAKIDAALHRIETGTYGICQASGLPIPAERLRAVPWASHLREIEAREESAPL